MREWDLRSTLVFLILATIHVSLVAQTPASKAIEDANQDAIVFVTATTILPSGTPDSAFGTAFIIHPNGYALTCAHVVPKIQGNGNEPTYLGIVGGRYGTSYPITVITRLPDFDLALIKLPRRSAPWPVMAADPNKNVDTGAIVYVLGFPGEGNLDVVSGEIRRDLDDGRLVTSAGIDHGSSGGPVFDTQGAVIGIAEGSVGDAQNVFIPMRRARYLLDILPPVPSPWVPPSNVQTTILPTGQAAFAAIPSTMRGTGPTGLSGAALEQDLARRGSLVLDGAHVVVGPPGAGETFDLRVYSLTLKNNARIVTNGNHLRLFARKVIVEGGSIISFEEGNQAAADGAPGEKGKDGLDGGSVSLEHIASVEGLFPIHLSGQDGGRGGDGTVGPPGFQGARGRAAEPGFIDCKRGGETGSQGSPGGKGGTGGTGGNGGSGGKLILVVDSGVVNKALTFDAPSGHPGQGGAGGIGGRGGPGGQGGNGAGLCGGGAPGAPGGDGPLGDVGPAGRVGQPGRIDIQANE